MVALLLELPSGGLADAAGRRPVLQAATGVSIVATAALTVVHSVPGLVAVMGLHGLFRALDSGPLPSWFVDEAFARDPEMSVERDLGRSEVTTGAALALGALGASVLVRLGPHGGLDPLVVPLVVSVAIQGGALVALTRLMHESRSVPPTKSRRSPFAGVPDVVRASLVTIRASRTITALVLAELLWGVGAVSMETLFPRRPGRHRRRSGSHGRIARPGRHRRLDRVGGRCRGGVRQLAGCPARFRDQCRVGGSVTLDEKAAPGPPSQGAYTA